MGLLNATSFIYNGVSSEAMGLAIGWIDSPSFDDNGLQRTVSRGDSTYYRQRANHYGFEGGDEIITFTFGVFPDPCSNLHDGHFDYAFSRQLNKWLMQPSVPAVLRFVDKDDSENYYYKAICTSIIDTPDTHGIMHKALTFECDCGHAYSDTVTFKGTCSGTKSITINNTSDLFIPYYPTVTLSGANLGGSVVTLTNSSLDYKLDLKIPSDVATVVLDGEHEFITDGTSVLPMYKVLNDETNFNTILKLTNGLNTIDMTGNFDYKIECIFPRRTGII